MAREHASLLVSLVVAALAASCLDLREPPPERHGSSCTTCHGSPVRPGSDLVRAAPPFDLAGRTDVRERGVGAHLIHLYDGPSHAAVPCATCHVVPEATDSPGHADDALPAEVVLGGLATEGGHTPSYDAGKLACADTYCHGGREARWIPSLEGGPRCGGCHAMPPPAPHPASDACHLCHAEVIDEARAIVAPALHVDGVVQVNERCDACHGAGPSGAPPPDLSGRTDVASIGVGAHAAHLAGGASARPVPCGACHVVPDSAGAPGHLDASPHAEIVFADVAVAEGRAPTWDRDALRCADSWCHGPSPGAGPSPRWNEAGELGCTSCHGMPPAAPHPQMEDCARCHGAVVDAEGAITNRALHVDGVVEVAPPTACDACHGSNGAAAPPPSLDGSTSTTSPGVGAHMRHLVGSGVARPVPCQECHVVPETVLAAGHLDSARPAEITFSGVAEAFGASPAYDGERCAATWCHGGKTAFGFPSGGTATQPVWTQVDGTQTTCTGCHGMPPPTPAHPPPPVLCSGCHGNVSSLVDIIDPSLHVNGVVDF